MSRPRRTLVPLTVLAGALAATATPAAVLTTEASAGAGGPATTPTIAARAGPPAPGVEPPASSAAPIPGAPPTAPPIAPAPNPTPTQPHVSPVVGTAPTEPRAAAASAAVLSASVPPTTSPVPGSYVWQLPRGFPIPAVPPDNPMSAAKVALGRRLFFEPRLSVTGHDSCSTCHVPARSFTDGKARATGALGDTLPRGAMALVNVAYNISFGWTRSGARSLEAQMRQPLFNTHPVELGLAGHEAAVVAELAADPSYATAFATVFPTPGGAPVTLDHAIQAVAAFERTLIAGDSPFDRYVFQGDHTALSDSAKRGMELFFSARCGCSSCHSGFNFTGTWRDAQGDTGKPAFANNGTGDQPMRVPTLRNVALTAPYMHDGRFPTLTAVVDHYFSLGTRAIRYDARLPRAPLDMQQKADLIAFLASLTDEAFVRRFAAP